MIEPPQSRLARLLAAGVLGIIGLIALPRPEAPPARAESPAKPAIDFNRQIRPILAENCFACHGPDKQKAGLRLDTREGLLGTTGIVFRGSPGASALIGLIRMKGRHRMPPPKSGKKLTPEQVDLLVKWVEAGAPWPEG
jgi:mono/diheme cytochrome c family protein